MTETKTTGPGPGAAAPIPERDHGGTVGSMSPQDFARLGLNHIAYIYAVRTEDDQTGWAIHAANGQRIGFAPTPEQAIAATRQHDMEPLSVH
jgi:hypothetical protein